MTELKPVETLEQRLIREALEEKTKREAEERRRMSVLLEVFKL